MGKDDAGERRRFDAIKVTYEGAPEPEQQAMLNELRFKLSTIPLGESAQSGLAKFNLR